MKLILIIACMFPVISFSQKPNDNIEEGKFFGVMPVVDSKITYTGVIQMDSIIKKDALYSRAKRYFVKTYKSGKDVIQLDDKENGQVIGKGFFKENWAIAFDSRPVSIYHTIAITCKDGRYKYEITDFVMKYYSSGSTIGSAYISGSTSEYPLEQFGHYMKKNARKFLTKVDKSVLEFIEELKSEMAKPIDGKDW